MFQEYGVNWVNEMKLIPSPTTEGTISSSQEITEIMNKVRITKSGQFFACYKTGVGLWTRAKGKNNMLQKALKKCKDNNLDWRDTLVLNS